MERRNMGKNEISNANSQTSNAKPKDPRLAIPEFRAAHRIVCDIVHEIDKTPYKRIPQLREAARDGDQTAAALLARYEKALADRRATTKRGA